MSNSIKALRLELNKLERRVIRELRMLQIATASGNGNETAPWTTVIGPALAAELGITWPGSPTTNFVRSVFIQYFSSLPIDVPQTTSEMKRRLNDV